MLDVNRPTARLADFTAQVRYEDLPPDVVAHTKRLILDAYGVGLHGSTTLWGRQIIGMAKDLGGSGESVLWGDGSRVSAVNAPLATGTCVHAFELEDTHRAGKIHLNCTMVPAATALAERTHATGKDLIAAAAVGMEIAIRVGIASNMAKAGRDRGWHATGVCGVLGAAATAARVLGLDTQTTANAIGLAGVQPVGLWSFKADGSNSKRFHAGRAASTGVLSALMAERGYTGPTQVLEAEDGGWFNALTGSHDFDAEALTGQLGEHWETANIGIKPFPSVRTTHTLLAALLPIVQREGLRPENIEKVTVFTRDSAKRQYGWDYRPKSVIAGQMTIPFVMALAIYEGDYWVHLITEDKLENPVIQRLMDKVEIVADPEIERNYPQKYTGGVEVTTTEGRRFKSMIDFPPGDPENPLTEEQLAHKFRRLAGTVLAGERVEKLYDAVLNLEECQDVTLVTQWLRP